MKRFFTSLIISAIGLISFGYCDTVWNSADNNIGLPNDGTFNLTPGTCIKPNAGDGCERGFNIYDTSNNLIYRAWNNLGNGFNGFICVDFNGYLKNENGVNCTYAIHVAETCEEQYTSLECEQEYGLMPIASCNAEYCELNELCTGNTANSQLFINGIRQQSMPFINLYIPEEIQRDYNYTGNSTQLDINIEGYGYDTEKMQSMVNTQYYKPTAEEMSGLVEKISDFLPLVAVALLIIWIRRVLKKVFRF